MTLPLVPVTCGQQLPVYISLPEQSHLPALCPIVSGDLQFQLGRMENTSLPDKRSSTGNGWLSSRWRQKTYRQKLPVTFSQTRLFIVSDPGKLVHWLSFPIPYPQLWKQRTLPPNSSKILIVKSSSWWWHEFSSFWAPSRVFEWEAPHWMSF